MNDQRERACELGTIAHILILSAAGYYALALLLPWNILAVQAFMLGLAGGLTWLQGVWLVLGYGWFHRTGRMIDDEESLSWRVEVLRSGKKSLLYLAAGFLSVGGVLLGSLAQTDTWQGWEILLFSIWLLSGFFAVSIWGWPKRNLYM